MTSRKEKPASVIWAPTDAPRARVFGPAVTVATAKAMEHTNTTLAQDAATAGRTMCMSPEIGDARTPFGCSRCASAMRNASKHVADNVAAEATGPAIVFDCQRHGHCVLKTETFTTCFMSCTAPATRVAKATSSCTSIPTAESDVKL